MQTRHQEISSALGSAWPLGPGLLYGLVTTKLQLMDDVVLSFANAVRTEHGSTFRWSSVVDDALDSHVSMLQPPQVSLRGGKGEVCFHCSTSVFRKKTCRSVIDYDHYSGSIQVGPGKFCGPECALGNLKETKAPGSSMAFTKWYLLEVCKFCSQQGQGRVAEVVSEAVRRPTGRHEEQG